MTIEIDNGILKKVTDSEIKNGTFNIPASVTQIGEYAFDDCPSLTQIDLPEGITKIGNGAFSRCTSLAKIKLPDSITEIGNFAFYDCTSLAQIDLPKGITKIGKGAFDGCTSLTQIDLPEGITKIGNGAFNGCTSLTQINLPKGITEIGNFAFDGCTRLAKIIIESDDEQEIKRIKDMLPTELHHKIMTLEEKKATDLHVPAEDAIELATQFNKESDMSYALLNFTAHEVTALKKLPGSLNKKIQQREQGDEHKKILFKQDEISTIKQSLAQINTEEAQNFSKKLEEKDTRVADQLDGYFDLDAHFNSCAMHSNITDKKSLQALFFEL